MKKYSDGFSQSILSIQGIGPKIQSQLSSIGINTLFELLLNIPTELIDKSSIARIEDMKQGDKVVVIGTITDSIRTKSLKPNYILTVDTGAGTFTVRFIHKIIIFMNLQVGIKIRVSGTVNIRKQNIEFIHPEIEIISDDNKLQKVIPRYSVKGRVSQKRFRKYIRDAFKIVSDNYRLSVLDNYFHDNFDCMSYLMALKRLHFPSDDFKKAIDDYHNARKRLIYEEFYLNKHEFIQTLRRSQQKDGHPITINHDQHLNFLKNLNFRLTKGQEDAISNLFTQFNKSLPSSNLVQGDVGCGKTLVAIMSCLQFIKNNLQCIVLVPTEILCQQHYETFSKYLKGHGVIEQLTGKSNNSEKSLIKDRLLSGEISILIGTHAVLYDDYHFKNLGLIVIDEQHKFGVKQREHISTIYRKRPHLMLMSATPIPRTLSLVIYENMNYIKIEDKPSNRELVYTKVFDDEYREELNDRISEHLNRGMQIYWVCTRVEDTGNDNLLSVKSFIKILRQKFSNAIIEILHGKINSQEKIEIINRFKSGDIDILVTTSVIEVGIDCPNANCLIIENSELFGLAQLHQLRGRVGRGVSKGFCYLVHQHTLAKESFDKIKYLENHHSGFEIAEYDLVNRGSGTLLGTKQSGLPDNYRLSSLEDIMDNIFSMKKFKYELSSFDINELKSRWNIKANEDIQL